jgi:carbonic anhydrase
VIIHHTECGMDGFDDAGFRMELAEKTGQEPTWDVQGFTDLYEDTRRSVEIVRTCPWIPHRDDVRGFVLDVATAVLSEVE